MAPLQATGIPRVTVAIPVYNAAHTLPLTLRSVFAQTLTDWELILVDDGSTDGSVEIMRAIRDDRVRVFVDGANKTQASRHNEATRAAAAPFIARLDSDDIMHPERLRRQLEFLDAHPEVHVVGTAAYSVDGARAITGRRDVGALPTSEFQVGLRGLFMHPTVMGTREWFLENLYDESSYAKRCEDAELWFRTFSHSCFALLEQPLLFYTEETGNVMKKLRSSNRGRLRIMFRGNGQVRKKGLGLRLGLAAAISLKMAYYELCWAAGVRDYLVRKRNHPLQPHENDEARAILERVARCPVPGLD